MDEPSPFEPENFGDMFADKLFELADDGSEIDCAYGEHHFECLVLVRGIEYRVTVLPEALRELVESGEQVH